MLQISDSIDDVGSVRPELAASLFVAWLIVFIALLKGVKSFGKVRIRFAQPLRFFISKDESELMTPVIFYTPYVGGLD